MKLNRWTSEECKLVFRAVAKILEPGKELPNRTTRRFQELLVRAQQIALPKDRHHAPKSPLAPVIYEELSEFMQDEVAVRACRTTKVETVAPKPVAPQPVVTLPIAIEKPEVVKEPVEAGSAQSAIGKITAGLQELVAMEVCKITNYEERIRALEGLVQSQAVSLLQAKSDHETLLEEICLLQEKHKKAAISVVKPEAIRLTVVGLRGRDEQHFARKLSETPGVPPHKLVFISSETKPFDFTSDMTLMTKWGPHAWYEKAKQCCPKTHFSPKGVTDLVTVAAALLNKEPITA